MVERDFPELSTERLKLRRLIAEDTVDWLAILNDPSVNAYLADFDRVPITLDDVKPLVEWADRIFANGGGMRWAITLKLNNTMIGTCGFHLYQPISRCADIGYELASSYWRQGIMYEAISALLRYGFDQMNLHRIQADVTEGNQASAGLLLKLGFTREGTWRDRVYMRGQFRDLWQFGMLEDEYRGKFRPPQTT